MQKIPSLRGHEADGGAPDDRARDIRLVCTAAQLVLENGGEVYRVEETAMRMAKGLGLSDVSVAAFPTSIFVDACGRTRIRRISRRGNNLTRLAHINDVSRRVERGEMTAAAAEEAMARIAAEHSVRQRTLVIAYALAAASFALMFGGGLMEFAAAFVIGLAVQAVQPLFAGMAMGALLGNFTGGLITAVAAQLSAMPAPGLNVNAAIIGGIMPLLSGLLMTTAVRDTMYGDLVSGVVRAVEALLIAASVALGVYAGLKLMAMTGGMPG